MPTRTPPPIQKKLGIPTNERDPQEASKVHGRSKEAGKRIWKKFRKGFKKACHPDRRSCFAKRNNYEVESLP